jgi:hypothetical protein
MSSNGSVSIDEVSIVDTCTKLIFGDRKALNETDVLIVAALQLSDGLLEEGTLEAIGNHIRQMGVEEMIRLVGRAKQRLDSNQLQVARYASNNLRLRAL